MVEKILIAVLGCGNLFLFIQFLIERKDRKAEREEDKAEKKQERAEDMEWSKILDWLNRLEKDTLRTQLLVLIILRPKEQTEILRIAEHYFKDLHGNWCMTSIFNRWIEEENVAKPQWFDID